jgi:hypothetical protein
MKPLHLLTRGLVLCLPLCLTTGCATFTKVPNPEYEAWAEFEPGSSVTFEGYVIADGDKQSFRFTDRLESVSETQVVIERTEAFADDQPTVTTVVEYAKIHPQDDALTNPDSTLDAQPDQSIDIKGRTFTCQVRELNTVQRTEDWAQTLRAIYLLHMEIPGRFVKYQIWTETSDQKYEEVGQLVDYVVMTE